MPTLEAIRTILVPTDFSAASQAALETAVALARRDDAAIHLLHSIRLPVLHTNYDINVPRAVWEGLRKGTRERMQESERWLEEAGVSEVGSIVSDAQQPAEVIERSARELDADLVVMATHGRRGLRHALLGSVTERTIRSAPIPVLAVKETAIEPGPLQRILVPIDFSPHSESALAAASALARRDGAHLDLLCVVEPLADHLRHGSEDVIEFDERNRRVVAERLEARAAPLRDEVPSIQSHLGTGSPAEAIAEEAERLDSNLVVMGTHGLTGIEHAMIGSVTERTLRLTTRPVLATKPATGGAAASR